MQETHSLPSPDENIITTILTSPPVSTYEAVNWMRLSLYVLERHLEDTYRHAWKRCKSVFDKQQAYLLHRMKLAQIECARVHLNKLYY